MPFRAQTISRKNFNHYPTQTGTAGSPLIIGDTTNPNAEDVFEATYYHFGSLPNPIVPPIDGNYPVTGDTVFINSSTQFGIYKIGAGGTLTLDPVQPGVGSLVRIVKGVEHGGSVVVIYPDGEYPIRGEQLPTVRSLEKNSRQDLAVSTHDALALIRDQMNVEQKGECNVASNRIKLSNNVEFREPINDWRVVPYNYESLRGDSFSVDTKTENTTYHVRKEGRYLVNAYLNIIYDSSYFLQNNVYRLAVFLNGMFYAPLDYSGAHPNIIRPNVTLQGTKIVYAKRADRIDIRLFSSGNFMMPTWDRDEGYFDVAYIYGCCGCGQPASTNADNYQQGRRSPT